MTCTGDLFMGLQHDDLRARLSDYLGARYTRDRAKRLARDIGDCDPRTAENILNGHWPSAKHWKGIVRAFGRDVLDAVFAPEIEPVVARLEAEVSALEQQLEEKRAQARKAQGVGPRLATVAALHEDRPASVDRRSAGERRRAG